MVTTTGRWKLTEPVGSVAAVLGALLLAALVAGAALTAFGPAGYRVFDGYVTGSVCVTQPDVQYSDSGWVVPPMVAARPGGSVSMSGALQACALHPALGQRVLYALAELPVLLLWGGVLLLVWQLIRIARRAGPFTTRAAIALRRLGWFILAGSLVAAAVRTSALDELVNTIARVEGGAFANLILVPFRALVPGPALAGAALLTVARILAAGAVMDDDLKGTV